MTLSSLEVLYTCFIVGGFVVPVLNVAIGALGSALGGGAELDADADLDVDLDIDTDLDAGTNLDTTAGHDVSGDHLKTPVNLMTLSLGAVVFGALGRLLLGKLNVWLGLYIAFQTAVLASFLLGRFVILPLKHNRAFASGIRHMVGAQGRIILEVREDFTGTVELLSATGTQVTYDARPDEGIPLVRRGEWVSVVAVDAERMLCIVRPLEDK